MTVDHFKPQARYPELRLIWTNLYYACCVCNSYYKKDFPTPEEEAEGKHFVDPCREVPDAHFRLVRDDETGDRYRVRPLSSAAEYAIFRLKLNRRKALRDFWRLLDQEESRLLQRENNIRLRLEDCSQAIHRYGPSEELRRLRSDYDSQLSALLTELQAVRHLRPFPVA